MANRILFRTRGGPTQGWGNVFRLAAFADLCKERGETDIHFLVEGPKEVPAFIESRGYPVTGLPDEVSLEDEGAALEALGRFDLVIMEMLECHHLRQRLLKRFADKVVVFDDLLDHTYECDLVICGQDLPSFGNISISSPATRFETGYDYFMFAPAYRRYIGKERALNSEVRTALVAFGGGRYDVAYLKAAHALARFPQVTPTFILGPAATRLGEDLQAILPEAKILGRVDNMDEMLFNSDLAIVSAGYLKLESAITRTPAIMIATQWHQIPLAEEFHAKAGMASAGYMGFTTPDELASLITQLLPMGSRQQTVEAALKAVDGKGSDRVLDLLFGEETV
ncbi:hypothetical protein GM415_12350 [Pseudodesulfovibrio cashew]|uniref:Glycosyltransferase n=1 Tax=Pseudodesulfovibrio cashew TaxID=2678688 RepID=A0A6I6JDI6_9BACT|nr:hypothetical protein [Pseudodesulfovibrio cashew]QGY40886.1 hypothetical protein GM415_12350 [Pseudodesulfovibrio cashew]